jgi:hypothetical protein
MYSDGDGLCDCRVGKAGAEVSVGVEVSQASERASERGEARTCTLMRFPLQLESQGTHDSTDSHAHVRPSFLPTDTHTNPPRHIDTGTYADDCLIQRVTVSKCYIVATVRPLPPPPLVH